ncbi:MAG: single-stranded DNA-binding protein [Planctomycetes bacterium]|nr:single-stranded DNA-binding protein [Planctomycetota bacterium]
MSSFNKVILMGNLTRDPEVRTTPGGQSVTELGIASNRTYTAGGPGGEKREEVTFVDVSFWGRAGEVIAQYLKKGDPIFVEGRLTFRQWEAKEGGKRSKLSVTGENFQFVGGRREGGGGGAGGGGGGRGYSEYGGGGGGGGGGAPAGGGGGQDEMEGFDEVPF